MVEHILKSSLERNLVVTIIYSGDSGISKRNIRVMEFQDKRIKAYCYLRNQVRYFKIVNILSAEYYKQDRKAV